MKRLQGGLRHVPSVGLLLCVVLVLAASSVLTRPTQAAGLYTHTVFVRRAIEKVKILDAQDAQKDYSGLVALLERQGGITNYGAIFPDLAAKADDPWGEWVTGNTPADQDIRYTYDPLVPPYEQRDRPIPSFRKAFIKELLPRFQHNPRTVQDEEMLAFLFGLIAHQEADVPWHLNDPGQNVIGLEAALNPLKIPGFLIELQVDNQLWDHDVNQLKLKEEPVQFGFWWPLSSTLTKVSRDAGTAAPGIEKMLFGEVTVQAAWGACTDNKYKSIGDVAFIASYPQGGIENGAELIAIAWMRTWDLMAYSPPGKLDLDPPTISGAATTPPNAMGWHTTSVTVHFTAEDALSGLDTVTPDQTVSAEGGGQSVVGVAVDRAWNRATYTVTINIDLTPPLVAVLPNQERYTRLDPLVAHLQADDRVGGSGIASLTATFNEQPLADNQAIDLFWLPLGSHPAVARAEDQADWVTEATQSIEMYATLESLQGTVSRLCQESYITKAATCTKLGARLSDALAARDRADVKAAVRSLKTFQANVRAQSRRVLPSLGSKLLLMDSDYVLKDLSRVPVPPGEVYVVQRGDWLMKVAQNHYGNPYLYRQIVEATNAKAAEDPSFLKIRYPHLIWRGQKLWLPTQPAPAP